ncbi:MFS transporter [Phycicoccus sp. CSK15P-2]|nr:MFS transporter [Phycicoccus sp. CSK15P-2]
MGAGFLLSADFSILNVAIPEIGAGVGLQLHQLAWISTAFALPAAGFTLLFGRFADLFGRRRMFMTAMVLLVVASVIGGLATTPAVLLTARALQGLATAMAIPASMSLLTTTFAEGSLRERVLGLNGALLSGGFSFGALAGGALVSSLGWRSAFWINVPVALVILAAAPVLLRESRTPGRVVLDVPGALAVTGGLLALVYGIVEGVWPLVGLGVLLLVAFWVIEMRATAPLAPVQILRRGSVTWGNLAGLTIFAMETGMIFLMTLYLQKAMGLSPLMTGVVFGVPGLMAIVAGIIAGRLIGAFGNVRLLALGMTVQSLAILPLVFAGTSRSALFVIVPCLFVGFFGHVAAIVAFTVTATSGLPDEEQGLATGLTSMTQQVAITVGTPVLSAIAASRVDEAAGIRFALVVNVVLTLVSMAVVWFGLHAPSRRPVQSPTLDKVEV